MRQFAYVAIGSAAGLVLLKLLFSLLLPAVGWFLGLTAMVLKIALVGLAAWLVCSFVKKRRCEGDRC